MTTPSSPPDLDPDEPIEIGDNEAKQGGRGRHALIVLLVSTALVVVALFALWMTRAGDFAEVQRRNAPDPAEESQINQPTGAVRRQAEPDEVP